MYFSYEGKDTIPILCLCRAGPPPPSMVAPPPPPAPGMTPPKPPSESSRRSSQDYGSPNYVSIITAHKHLCGTVMFSEASVCSRGWGGAVHMVGIPSWERLGRQTPPLPMDTRPGPLLVTSGGHDWRPET